ncbi:hypothetical protein CYMTET_5637 [Cymbomonas tetramitiformis]|uniref:Uncharacterized protein n=1 Tax=Cymbomonas tetramitiformis TaxID=36881 RepID=A0AAE0GNL1_9CHLO|nr:hypothetical protein CYMTET_10770 [Cymbomonas tetramitiformis]KAK3286822.1 hypothetical protein CYMTET_5637 [Cymbomonas tetramitiformis]
MTNVATSLADLEPGYDCDSTTLPAGILGTGWIGEIFTQITTPSTWKNYYKTECKVQEVPLFRAFATIFILYEGIATVVWIYEDICVAETADATCIAVAAGTVYALYAILYDKRIPWPPTYSFYLSNNNHTVYATLYLIFWIELFVVCIWISILYIYSSLEWVTMENVFADWKSCYDL